MNFVRAKERSTNTLFSYVCLRDATRNDSKIGRRVCVAGRATLCDHSIRWHLHPPPNPPTPRDPEWSAFADSYIRSLLLVSCVIRYSLTHFVDFHSANRIGSCMRYCYFFCILLSSDRSRRMTVKWLRYVSTVLSMNSNLRKIIFCDNKSQNYVRQTKLCVSPT